MTGQCKPVFDLMTAGYTAWPIVAAGSGVTLVMSVILVIISRAYKLPGTICFVPVLTGLLTIGLFLSTWTEYRAALAARISGRYEVVEGRIENFVPEPFRGHSKESFTVAGRRIQYGTFVMTPGFHRSRARGGPFDTGIHVRLFVRGDDILYAEVCEK
jgi:hypothetical protein